MSVINRVEFTDHQAAIKAADKYLEIEVDVARVLESWRGSLFSFEWLARDGSVKPPEELKDADQARFAAIKAAYEAGEALEKPVLGIGLQDNVEIGSGKAVFLTLAALGTEVIPVHILKTHAGEFKDFAATVK